MQVNIVLSEGDFQRLVEDVAKKIMTWVQGGIMLDQIRDESLKYARTLAENIFGDGTRITESGVREALAKALDEVMSSRVREMIDSAVARGLGGKSIDQLVAEAIQRRADQSLGSED